MILMENICDYKLAIVTPNSIVYRGKISDDTSHKDVMINYGVEKYGKNSIFGIFDGNTKFNVVEYYLASYDNILFYNLSGEGVKFGILCTLNNISDKQLKLVNILLDSLEGFTVEYDSYVNIDGELVMNNPIEDYYEEDFLEIRNFLKDISIKEKSM